MRYLKKKENFGQLVNKPEPALKNKCIAFKSSYQKSLGLMKTVDKLNKCFEMFNALLFKARYDYIGYLMWIGRYNLIRHLFADKKSSVKRYSRIKKLRKKRSQRMFLRDSKGIKIAQNQHSFFNHCNQVKSKDVAIAIAANEAQIQKSSRQKHSAPIIR